MPAPHLLAVVYPDLPITKHDLHTVPTGHDYNDFITYVHWLWGNYIQRWNPPWVMNYSEAWQQQWSWAAVLIGTFWLFSFYFSSAHRGQKELYKPVFYGGSITERHGKFGPFSIITTAGLVFWAFFYAIEHTLLGQIY